MKISVFSSKYDTTASIEEFEIYEAVSNPVIMQDKSGKLITTSIFANNSRETGSTVIETPALWLDFDGTDKFFYVCEVLSNLHINFAAYTTFSHTRAVHRFRTIIPCIGLSPGNYAVFSSYFCMVNKLKPDPTSRQAGRIYYPPICRDTSEYLYTEAGNYNDLAVTPNLSQNLTKSNKPVAYENLTEHSLSLACYGLKQVAEGGRNTALYNLAFKYSLSSLPKNLVSKKLYDAAIAAGLEHREVINTIGSAMTKARVTTNQGRDKINEVFK